MLKIKIIGAGIAGAMASGYFSSSKPVVFEASENKKAKLNKHKAVMRIRDPRVGMILGTDMKEIDVYKQCLYRDKLYWESDIRMRNLYSIKINGDIEERSITNLGKVKRYLLTDFELSDVNYESKVVGFGEDGRTIQIEKNGELEETEYDYCISTIPVFELLSILKIKTENSFPSKDIHIVRTKSLLKSEVHQTIYIPEEKYDCYRATLEGEEMIFESANKFPKEEEIEELSSYFGIKGLNPENTEKHTQKMGKIIPTEDDFRRTVIVDLTERYNIFSLGRFAVWKQIKTDDLIQDLDLIRKMIGISDAKRIYKSRIV
jgi:hypothetical protein